MAEGIDSLVGLTDEQLMARVVSRDTAAFELLYDRHAGIVLGLCVKIVGERTIGEELLQETYWRLWTQAATFDADKGPLKAWLFSIARRQALDSLRRGRVRPQAPRDEMEARQVEIAAAPGDPVDETAAQAIDAARIRDALTRLPEEQQQVLALAYFGGLTRQEIARTTNTPLGTVHTRARLGLRNLRAMLGEAEGT